MKRSEKYKAVENRLRMEVLEKYDNVRYCPVCSKALEINPNSGWKACFADGDLEIYNLSIVWRPLN